MKKKIYISPKIVVEVINFNTFLLAGSPVSDSKVTVNINGDGTIVSSTPEDRKPGSNGYIDIDYSKQHSAMESWDSWD